MFLSKYLDEEQMEELIDNYNINYLNKLDEDTFKNNCNLLKSYDIDFIDELIIKLLPLFEMDTVELEKRLNILKDECGTNFVEIIESDINVLESIIKY